MKSSSKSLFVMMFIWMISILSYFWLPVTLAVFQILMMIVLILIMNFFQTKTNFVVLITSILVYGFALTLYAYMNHIYDQEQVIFIIGHILFSTTLILSWLILNHVKALLQVISEQNAQLQKLKKIDEQTHSLSIQEFKEQALLIETAAKRHQEEGRFLYFKMDDAIPIETQESLQYEFVQICLKTVRTKYDLVSALSEKEILLLLQGTNKIGEEIVTTRIQNNLHKSINFIELPYTAESYTLSDGVENVLATIAFQQKGSQLS